MTIALRAGAEPRQSGNVTLLSSRAGADQTKTQSRRALARETLEAFKI